MKEVRNTLMGEKLQRAYVAPESKVVLIHSEGLLCSSVTGSGHDDFTDGGSFDL